MAVRKAQALWEGSLREGHGLMKFGSFEGPYTFASRFEEGYGTNPEELIGAAHAGCFLDGTQRRLGRAGFTPQRIHTLATVTLGTVGGQSAHHSIHLDCEARSSRHRPQIPSPGSPKESKDGCPVSAALGDVQVTLDAKLV